MMHAAFCRRLGAPVIALASGCAQHSASPPMGPELVAAEQHKLATSGPKPFDAPQEAQDFFMAQRLGPGQAELPMQHLRQALDGIVAREARPRGPMGSGGPAPVWEWLGPGNIGGRTRALAIDPADPDVMYAAGVAGGVWKTTDGGASWDAADDLLINLAVVWIVIDPQDTSVLYAGTGEGYLGGSPGVRGLGIFKSTDAGLTWNQLPGTVTGVPAGSFHYVNRLVISPNDSSRLYAGTRHGVWRSIDAGDTWSIVLANPNYNATPPTTAGSFVGCTDLKVRPDSSPDQLWAAFGSFSPDGLYRSDDGGDTWTAFTMPSNQGRMSIAFAPSDNDVMYLLMADNGTGGQLGQLVDVYRSLDGGDTWTGRVAFDTLTGPWLLSNLILATGCLEGSTYSQGWYDNIIAVDPVDPAVVWVGGVDIFRSDDGGANWGIAGYWVFYTLDPPPPYNLHPDHHNIVFPPQYDGTANQTMYVTNDGGLFRTANARAATSQEDCPLPANEPLPEITWENVNNNYGVTQFYHGDAARLTNVFIGGCQDNGTNRVQSAGAPNDWSLIFGGDGGYTAIDPRDPDVMFVEYQGFPTIMKSTDGGESFVEATNGITDTDGLFITPIAMDQSDPDVLYTGGRRVWRTADSAGVWEPASPDFAGPDRISAIGIAPSDDNVVYLGFNNGYVARSTDAKSASPSWQVFTNGLYGAWVSSVAVDPQDVDTACITYSTFGAAHVLRTINGGLNWISIDGIDVTGVPDIPAHWVAVRPCDPDELFVGTEFGVFRSADAGQTWDPFNDGLAHTVVEALDWPDDDTLVAFSHGRGAFRIALPSCGPCTADTNEDGSVGVDDFLGVLSSWGFNPTSPADVNGDTWVNVDDFLAVLFAWGPCPS